MKKVRWRTSASNPTWSEGLDYLPSGNVLLALRVRSRSTSTSRATRIAPSASRGSSASRSPRTSLVRTWRGARASSGSVGTSRSRPGSATTSTCRSAGTASPACGRT
jgi:hypothetical protein